MHINSWKSSNILENRENLSFSPDFGKMVLILRFSGSNCIRMCRKIDPTSFSLKKILLNFFTMGVHTTNKSYAFQRKLQKYSCRSCQHVAIPTQKPVQDDFWQYICDQQIRKRSNKLLECIIPIIIWLRIYYFGQNRTFSFTFSRIHLSSVGWICYATASFT